MLACTLDTGRKTSLPCAGQAYIVPILKGYGDTLEAHRAGSSSDLSRPLHVLRAVVTLVPLLQQHLAQFLPLLLVLLMSGLR